MFNPYTRRAVTRFTTIPQEWHAIYTFLPATHTFVHEWNEPPCIPIFTLVSCPTSRCEIFSFDPSISSPAFSVLPSAAWNPKRVRLADRSLVEIKGARHLSITQDWLGRGSRLTETSMSVVRRLHIWSATDCHVTRRGWSGNAAVSMETVSTVSHSAAIRPKIWSRFLIWRRRWGFAIILDSLPQTTLGRSTFQRRQHDLHAASFL